MKENKFLFKCEGQRVILNMLLCKMKGFERPKKDFISNGYYILLHAKNMFQTT